MQQTESNKDPFADLRSQLAAQRAKTEAAKGGASEELALLDEMERLVEEERDADIDAAVLDLKKKALAGERSGIGVRVGVFRFGTGSVRGGIAFRQPSPGGWKSLMATPDGPETETANKKAVSENVLWYSGQKDVPKDATAEQRHAHFVQWMTDLSASLPHIWTSLVLAWLRHVQDAAEYARGKA